MNKTLGEVWARARVRAARRIGRVLLGSVVGKVPLASIRCLEEHVDEIKVKNHIVDIMTTYPPRITEFAFPETYPLWFRRSKAFDKRSIYRLRDVFVSPQSGLVWLPEGHILEESAVSHSEEGHREDCGLGKAKGFLGLRDNTGSFSHVV